MKFAIVAAAFAPPIIFNQVVDPVGLAQYGVMGLILTWFMFRLERKLDSLTSVINDFISINAVDVLSRETLPSATRDLIEKILDRTKVRSSSLKSASAVQ